MTTPTPAPNPRHTRQWTHFAKWIITRDHAICWLCGHPGADTADHVIPLTTRPDLCFDPDNVRAAHGAKRTQLEHGFDCIGNYSRQDAATRERPTIARRNWLLTATVLALKILHTETAGRRRFLSPPAVTGFRGSACDTSLRAEGRSR